MSLANYFENVKGIGVLGTADPEGKVDLAICARPQVLVQFKVDEVRPLAKERSEWAMPSAVGEQH